MKKRGLRLLTLLIGVGLILGGFPVLGVLPGAFAQEDEATVFVLEEIIVTAERRETNAQDTPVAVTAFDSGMLDEEAIDGIHDLQMRMPSTIITSNKIYIRGVGREMNQLGIEPGIGVYYDGFYNSEIAFNDLFDVERVESVRGPQSTLYGKASIGGAINLVNKRPSKEVSGQLRARFGPKERREFNLAFGGPIYGDKLMGRVTVKDYYFKGHIKNIAINQYIGGDDSFSISLKLLYQPTGNLSFYSDYWFTTSDHSSVDSIYREAYNTDPAAATAPLPNQTEDSLRINPSTDDPWKVSNNSNYNHHNLDGMGIRLTTTYELGNFTVKHLQKYADVYGVLSTDADGFAHPVYDLGFYVQQEFYNWAQELQFVYGGEGARFGFIGGLYYYFNHDYQDVAFPTVGYWQLTTPQPALLFTPKNIPQVQGSLWSYQTWNDTTSKSIYGEFDFRLTDTLNLTVGGRYGMDEKKGWERLLAYIELNAAEYSDIDDALIAATGFDSATLELFGKAFGYRAGYPGYDDFRGDRSGEWDAVMGKVGLDYTPAEGALLYGSISRGYKPGGFALGTYQPGVTIDPEFLLAYEIGYKQLWQDGRYRTNLTGYYYDYEDLQVTTSLDNKPAVENAEGADNYGIELEATGYVMDQLLMTFTGSFNVAEYRNFVAQDPVYPDEPAQNLKGNRMNRTPKIKWALSGTYTIPTSIGGIALYAIYYWQDDTYFRPFEDAISRQEQWDRFDAQVRWSSLDYKWRVSLHCNNIFDKEVASDVGVSGIYPDIRRDLTLIPPRDYGIEISYMF